MESKNDRSIYFHFPGKDDEPIVVLKECGDILVRGKLIENDKELVEGLREWLTLGRVAAQREILTPCEEADQHQEMKSRASYRFCPYCGVVL